MDLFQDKSAMVIEDRNLSALAQNIKAMSLFVSKTHFLIKPSVKETKLKSNLIIDRSNGHSFEEALGKPSSLDMHQFNKGRGYSAFLGCITILDQAFLFMVEDVKHICSLEGHDIFRVHKIQFIPFIVFENETEFFNSAKGKEIQYHI